jgi:hypothetical protein
MTIQFNTDKNITGHDTFTAQYVSQIEEALRRYSHHISRIEVHLSDEDGSKDGSGAMRCMMEARVDGRQPTTVTSQADTHDQAVSEALNKLTNSLDTIFGRLSNH